MALTAWIVVPHLKAKVAEATYIKKKNISITFHMFPLVGCSVYNNPRAKSVYSSNQKTSQYSTLHNRINSPSQVITALSTQCILNWEPQLLVINN